MKIAVLNGSPKGEQSVTMQYIKYMGREFGAVEFHVIHIAQGIRQIERDGSRFDAIIDEVKSSDAVLWAFPLYVLTVHSNYMRFIELISERGAGEAFAGKYAVAFSTSIHFFDHTAHNYIRAVCEDLGMNYLGFHSAAMDDLLKAGEREKLRFFTKSLLEKIEIRAPAQRLYAPVNPNIAEYSPGPAGHVADNNGLKTLLITDRNEDGNLGRMAKRLLNAFRSPAEVLDLRTADIKGGCLGCLKCGFDNVCAYDGSDGIREIYDGKVKNSDIIIFALELKGRFFSSRFKAFMDRRFLHTHQPQMAGKQVAFLVSGPLGQNANVLEILQGITELDQANLAGIVTDECDSAVLDAQIDRLAQDLVEYARAKHVRPATFLGVGGQKLFRDEIYGHLRFVFRQDHLYYKRHGLYDFPQKDIRMRLTNLVMSALTRIPKVKEQIRNDLVRHMVEPYKHING